MSTSELVERLKAQIVVFGPAKASALQMMVADLRAAALRLSELEADNARLSKWEWICDYDEPERQSDNIVSLADDMDLHGVMHVSGYREVCRFWIAHRCLSVDDEGEPDETEVVEFKTAEEAERCWPESLAKARAALTGEA